MSLTKVTYSMIEGTPINVLDYGAVGDGVTNDTTAIQAAITAAIASGAEIFIPAGTYLVNGFTITDSHVRLVGEGPGSTILKLNADANMFTISSAGGSVQYNKIANMSLDPNGYSKSAIYLTGNNINDYHIFSNLEISGPVNAGFFRSIKIDGRSIWNSFEDIVISGDRDSGVWCETASAVNLCTFTRVFVDRSQKNGFYFNRTPAADYFKTLSFYSCNSEVNGLDTANAKNSGFYFINVGETLLDNCYVEENGVGSLDGLDAAIRTEGNWGGISINSGLYWGSTYGLKLDAGLQWGNISGFRSSGINSISATNASSSLTFGGFYGDNPISTPNISQDEFIATVIPFKLPVLSETLPAQDLSRKNILRYTNSSPIDITGADLTNANPGHILWVMNIGSSTVTLKHNNASLVVPGGADLVITSNKTAMLVKESPTRWFVTFWSP